MMRAREPAQHHLFSSRAVAGEVRYLLPGVRYQVSERFDKSPRGINLERRVLHHTGDAHGEHRTCRLLKSA